MEVRKEEDFIPDIIPPEIKEEAPAPPPSTVTINVLPKKKEEAITTSAFHIHHAIVGLGIIGASALALAIPSLKPTTKMAIAGLGVTVGALLVYDDIIQHQEGNCDIATIFNFTPCPQAGKVTVVRKPQ